MGPRQRGRGNDAVVEKALTQWDALQWGRVSEDAETLRVFFAGKLPTALQWGRVSEDAETGAA